MRREKKSVRVEIEISWSLGEGRPSDKDNTNHRAGVQIEHSAEVQIKEKPKRRVMRPAYL